MAPRHGPSLNWYCSSSMPATTPPVTAGVSILPSRCTRGGPRFLLPAPGDGVARRRPLATRVGRGRRWRFGWAQPTRWPALASCLRVTTTLKVLVRVLPARSAAVQVTVVVPTGNRDPDAGVQVTGTLPSLVSMVDGSG